MQTSHSSRLEQSTSNLDYIFNLCCCFALVYLGRSRASCEAGSAGGNGRPSSRTTSALPTLRA